MTPAYLSATQIKMLLRCEFQYMYRYPQGLKTPPTGEMKQSGSWHKTLARNWNQKKVSEKDLPLKEMTDCFTTTFDKDIKEEEVNFNKDTSKDLRKQGLVITELHHKEFAPKIIPILVEERFEVPMGEGLPPLVGIWDLVDTEDCIIDQKAYGKSIDQKDADSDLQLSFYSLGYRLQEKKKEKGLRLDIIVKNKQPKKLQLETTRTKEQLQWLLMLYQRAAHTIETETFTPNPIGWHCSPAWCGYYERCHHEISTTWFI